MTENRAVATNDTSTLGSKKNLFIFFEKCSLASKTITFFMKVFQS